MKSKKICVLCWRKIKDNDPYTVYNNTPICINCDAYIEKDRGRAEYLLEERMKVVKK